MVSDVSLIMKLINIGPGYDLDGDRLRTGKPSRYVTSQLGSTQPSIPPGSAK